jgi:hypothetical protein
LRYSYFFFDLFFITQNLILPYIIETAVMQFSLKLSVHIKAEACPGIARPSEARFLVLVINKYLFWVPNYIIYGRSISVEVFVMRGPAPTGTRVRACDFVTLAPNVLASTMSLSQSSRNSGKRNADHSIERPFPKRSKFKSEIDKAVENLQTFFPHLEVFISRKLLFPDDEDKDKK